MTSDSVFPRMGAIIAAFVAVPMLGLWLTCGASDVDERIPVHPGGQLTVELTLGSGLSFDKGSLVIASHEENEVHVVAETAGWGVYAVDIEVAKTAAGVRVTGEVSGFLHWLFGGPTVDLQVHVPPRYSVDARIDGGPIVVEDLIGTVAVQGGSGGEWSIQPVDLSLHRLKGNVSVVSMEGAVEVEDVDGALEIETTSGPIEVRNVRGRLTAETERGRIDVDSVDGAIRLATTEDASISVDGVRGNLRAVSHHGRIEVEDMKGNVDVETHAGRIEVEDLSGQITARSKHGAIDVEFITTPVGVIEVEHGSITVRVPRDAEFDLQVDGGRGHIDLDSDLALVPYESPPAVSASASASAVVADFAQLGQEFAAAVTSQVQESVREFQRTRLYQNWDWQPDVEWNSTWESPEEGHWRWKGTWELQQNEATDHATDPEERAESEARRETADEEREAAEARAEAEADARDAEADARDAERERGEARAEAWADTRPALEPGRAFSRIGSLIEGLHLGRNRVAGRVNGGGPMLRLATRAGRIAVEER